MNDFKEVIGIENIGGCDGFMFADVDAIAYIPSSGGGGVDRSVVMKTGRFLKGYASLTSLSFEETQSETVQGTLYTTSIKGKYPKLDAEMLKLFTLLVRSRTIVTVLDNNLNLRIAGTVDIGLKFKYKDDTGGKASELNGAQFEFYGQGISPSPFYNAPVGSPGMEIV